VLRNTNFAAQKYEIINGLIHRAFLPRETRRSMTSAAFSLAGGYEGKPLPDIADHHSLATVTLDNTEEDQFRAVVWSVLFSMAEEALPPTILKLAFVEIPQRLFDSLFLMALNVDSGTYKTM